MSSSALIPIASFLLVMFKHAPKETLESSSFLTAFLQQYSIPYNLSVSSFFLNPLQEALNPITLTLACFPAIALLLLISLFVAHLQFIMPEYQTDIKMTHSRPLVNIIK